MLYLVGSFILASLDILVLWLLSKGYHWAWITAVGMYIFDTPYYIITGQYGFIVHHIICIIVAIYGWRKWKDKSKQTALGSEG